VDRVNQEIAHAQEIRASTSPTSSRALTGSIRVVDLPALIPARWAAHRAAAAAAVVAPG
jgi:hypothetical protein